MKILILFLVFGWVIFFVGCSENGTAKYTDEQILIKLKVIFQNCDAARVKRDYNSLEKSADELLYWAEQLKRSKDWKEAMLFSAYSDKGYIRSIKGEYKEAIHFYENAFYIIKADTDMQMFHKFDVALLLAEAYHEIGNLMKRDQYFSWATERVTYFEREFEAGNHDYYILDRLGQYFSYKGKFLLSAKKYSSALECFLKRKRYYDHAESLHPRIAGYSFYLLAIVYADLMQWERCIEYSQRTVAAFRQNDEFHWAAYKLLVKSYIEIGDYDNGLQYSKSLLTWMKTRNADTSVKRDFACIYYCMGKLYEKEGNSMEAEKNIKMAESYQPLPSLLKDYGNICN